MRINVLLLTSLLVAGPALAGEAHVCKSQTVANSAANAELTDNTVFKCGENISGTIPSLAREGWKRSGRCHRSIKNIRTIDHPEGLILSLIIHHTFVHAP